MSVGKVASQAGHAYLGAYLNAPKTVQDEYHSGGIGTKVCLNCPNMAKLAEAYAFAKQNGLPCVMIEDSGESQHCFNGVPTVTAVGIGPVTKSQVPFLKKFQLMK